MLVKNLSCSGGNVYNLITSMCKKCEKHIRPGSTFLSLCDGIFFRSNGNNSRSHSRWKHF